MGNWETLRALAAVKRDVDWGSACADQGRSQRLSFEAAGLRLDLSREHLDSEVLAALTNLAEEAGWEAKRAAQWRGDIVNVSEQRAVLHGALRCPERGPAAIASKVATMERALCEQVARLQKERPTAAVLHIGIGGSDLGPRLAAEVAPKSQQRRPLHFLNNLDDLTVQATLQQLDPHNTIVVVVSKSFTTVETRTLQEHVVAWLQAHSVDVGAALIAVTGNASEAKACGVLEERVLDLPDWVGGRFSLWSAVSLSLALAYGLELRAQLIAGARAMDLHFLDTPIARNLPVLAALVGIWQRNAEALSTRIVVPYADSLRLLPEYLQQLEMESNGKRVDSQGQPLGYETAPVSFGGAGSCVQHAFFQLLHQSDSVHPVEFVVPAVVDGVEPVMQRRLVSNAVAQACALTQGRSEGGEDENKHCPGGRPTSFIGLRKLDFYHLGALLAFYEHRTAVQGWIWNINSYDQFGVEIGKKIAAQVEQAWTGDADFPDGCAAAVAAWLQESGLK